MREVGVVAERGATGYLKEWEIPFGIREREFHSIMRMVIAAETGGQKSAVPVQIITGFPTGSMVYRAGIRRPFFFDDPRFSEIAAAGLESITNEVSSSAEAKASGTTVILQSLIAEADSITTASDAMTEAIIARLARSLQTSTSEINASKPLHSYGVDSLLAVEMVNWILKETMVTLSVLEVLATMPISELAMKIVGKTPAFQKQSNGE